MMKKKSSSIQLPIDLSISPSNRSPRTITPRTPKTPKTPRTRDLFKRKRSLIDTIDEDSINDSINNLVTNLENDQEISISYQLIVHAKLSVSITDSNFLKIKDGDKLMLTTNQNTNYNTLNVISNGKVGRVPISALSLDIHSWNIYLEVIDLITSDIDLMLSIINSLEEHDIDDFVKLIIANKSLNNVLKDLFYVEINDKLQRNLITELFRSITPSIKIMTAILNDANNISLKKFKDDFIELIIKLIEQNNSVNDIIEKCCYYLISLPSESIPCEIIIILRALRDTLLRFKEFNNNDISILLGSIFFLRFICPSLSQLENKNTLMIAKILQLISNQTEPNNDNNLLELNGLLQLYRQISDFLIRISSMPVPHLLYNGSLIKLAARYYSQILEMDNIDQNKLAYLKARLGDSPTETELPIWNKIIEMRTFIKKLNNNN